MAERLRRHLEGLTKRYKRTSQASNTPRNQASGGSPPVNDTEQQLRENNIGAVIESPLSAINTPGRSQAAVQSLVGPQAITIPSDTRNVLLEAENGRTNELQESTPCFYRAIKRLEKEDSAAFKWLRGSFASRHGESGTRQEWLERFTELCTEFRESSPDSANTPMVTATSKRYLPTLNSVQTFTMTMSRLDPHGIAPLVSAGVFFILQVVLNTIDPEIHLLILDILSETIGNIHSWTIYEQRYLFLPSGDGEGSLRQSKLATELEQLYICCLRLLISVSKNIDSNRKTFAAHMGLPRATWERDLKLVKHHQKLCSDHKAEIESLEKSQDSFKKTLQWLSVTDGRSEHNERRKLLKDPYQDIQDNATTRFDHPRGSWLFEMQEYKCWAASIEESSTESSILWLKGTMGTGKSILTSELIEWWKDPDHCSRPVLPLYMYCSAVTHLDYCIVIRSLCRQVASEFHIRTMQLAEAFHREHTASAANEDKAPVDVELWENLLVNMIHQRSKHEATVLFIDGLDECAQMTVKDTLDGLNRLTLRHKHLHVFLASQPQIQKRFQVSASIIRVDAVSTGKDMERYIKSETHRRALDSDSIIFSNFEFCATFENALLRGANGMFQWVKTWFAIMDSPGKPVVYRTEAKELLNIVQHQNVRESNRDAAMELDKHIMAAYKVLYNRDLREIDRLYRARAFRIFLCALVPLTLHQLAEAVYYDKQNEEDFDADNVRRLCFNFIDEGEDGLLRTCHDSARHFLESSDDFTGLKNHQEMARICVDVMSNHKHKIWKAAGMDPEEWATRWADRRERDDMKEMRHYLREPGAEVYTKWKSPRNKCVSTKAEVQEKVSAITSLLSRPNFAVYIFWYWWKHFETLCSQYDHTSENSWDIVLREDTAITGWTLIYSTVTVLDMPPGQPFHLPVINFNGDGARHTLYMVKEGRFHVSRLHALASWHIACPRETKRATEMLPEPATKVFSNLTCLLSSFYEVENHGMLSIFGDLDRRNTGLGNVLHVACQRNVHMIPIILAVGKLSCGKGKEMRGESLWKGKLLGAGDKRGNTPAHYAIRSPDEQSIRALLTFEARELEIVLSKDTWSPWYSELLNSRNSEGCTALMQAVYPATNFPYKPILETILETILEMGAILIQSPGEKNIVTDTTQPIREQNYVPCIHIPAIVGNAEAVEFCLRMGEVDLDQRDRGGYTALIQACRKGHAAVVDILLREKVDLNQQNELEETVLVLAAQNGHKEIVNSLLARADCEINHQNHFGYTALLHAAKYGHKEIVNSLLARADCEINHQDDWGFTALMYAVDYSHKEIVNSLLAREECEINRQDDWGFTALLLAARAGRKEIVNSLLAREECKINHQDRAGDTALLLAARAGRKEIVNSLLARADCEINHQDRSGNTALMKAARNQENIVELLLAKGDLDVNRTDSYGRAAIFYACREGRAEIVKLLLSTGKIDVKTLTTKDIDGKSAHSIVSKKRVNGIVVLLEEHFGADTFLPADNNISGS